MTVTVYARHSSKCSKSKDKNAGQWKRCKCPLWLQWNKDADQFKKSAKTRSWDIATKTARKLEQDLALEALGIEPINPPDEIAVRFHHRLVQIHPFPNGNGRHARLVADLLVMRLGGERFSWGSANLHAVAGEERSAEGEDGGTTLEANAALRSIVARHRRGLSGVSDFHAKARIRI